VRVEEEESQEISEMKQTRRSWERVPARVREEPRSCRGTLYADGIGRGHNFWGTYQRHTLVEVRHLASAGWAPRSDGFRAVETSDQRSALSFVVKSGIANVDLVRLT
jgi:hypothetical protein